MTTIISGGFDVYSKTQAAIERLRQAGIADEYVCEFRINPPGEHDMTPIGGDHDASLGMKHGDSAATKGAAAGAAIGVAAGITAAPLLGPAGILAGAAVGGYTGSLVGSLRHTETTAQPDATDVRPAEAMVAVNVDGAAVAAEDVVRIFEECGAHQVERAQGTWTDGEWSDFDPSSRPRLVGGSDQREAGGASVRT